MCPLRHQTTDGINAICCRIKHNRAKPMFESASAIFSIADAGEFRFARFYIVCEEVPLGTPESPPIVSGVSDMHPSDFPNVEETRNPMQTFSRKKCSHFSPTNIPSAFPSEIGRMYFLSYSFARQKGIVCSKRQSLFLPLYAKTRASHPHLPQIFCFILR